MATLYAFWAQCGCGLIALIIGGMAGWLTLKYWTDLKSNWAGQAWLFIGVVLVVSLVYTSVGSFIARSWCAHTWEVVETTKLVPVGAPVGEGKSPMLVIVRQGEGGDDELLLFYRAGEARPETIPYDGNVDRPVRETDRVDAELVRKKFKFSFWLFCVLAPPEPDRYEFFVPKGSFRQ